MALTLTDPHLDVCQPCPLKHTDCSGRSKSLPGKPNYQRLKLFGAELHLGAMSTAGPVKLALSQPASSQPDSVDADQRSKSLRSVAHAAALSAGQFTTAVPRA